MTHVLIVDDAQTDVQVLKTMLEKNGFETSSATSGEEGIQKAKGERPDVILMDIVMPGLNGFQAIRQLSRDPDTAGIPIIIVTTKDQASDKAWGLKQGARDFITKPTKEKDLVSKIRAVLEGATQ